MYLDAHEAFSKESLAPTNAPRKSVAKFHEKQRRPRRIRPVAAMKGLMAAWLGRPDGATTLKTTNLSLVLAALLAASTTSGCAGFRQAIGTDKTAPDEFRVVSKAPLVVPPEFNLRPPRPGEARPMELRADLQARTAVFGVQMGASASEGERLLVAKAGGTNADPRIRAVIDEETGGVARKPTKLADRIMSFGAGQAEQPANPVNGEAEAERLRLEALAVRNATGGQAPTIQQNKPRGFKLPGM
jgi:Protein of unknown function (DUF3035)